MRPLDDEQRKRLLAWSALLCAVPICLAPLAGRSSFELASEQAAFDARFSAPQLPNVWSDKPVSIARDPFVPEVPPASKELAGENATLVGVHVSQGDSTGFPLPLARAGAFTVRAIVSGPSPRALIDDGAHVRVVGIGDVVGGSRVVRIDDSGVDLQNGTLMPLSEEHP